MYLFSEMKIFSLWILFTGRARVNNQDLAFGFYSYNSGHFCFNGLF